MLNIYNAFVKFNLTNKVLCYNGSFVRNINTQGAVDIRIDDSLTIDSLGISVNVETVKDVDVQIVFQEDFITA